MSSITFVHDKRRQDNFRSSAKSVVNQLFIIIIIFVILFSSVRSTESPTRIRREENNKDAFHINLFIEHSRQ